MCFLSPRALLDCSATWSCSGGPSGVPDQPDPALVEASLDADAENALPIAQPRTPAGNGDESVDVVVCVEINVEIVLARSGRHAIEQASRRWRGRASF